MSFMDGKPRVATEQECKAKWCGEKPGAAFRCYLCGYKFKVGDYWRCVFTNYANANPDAAGNPLVCRSCDDGNENVTKRWAEKVKAFYEMLNAPENWKLKGWYNND
jgi:hypothetical protein